MGITIGIATASLLARDISGSEDQAGLAQTFQVLGAAVASYLLARLMSRRGRRVGLVTGYVLGAGGAVLAVLAGVVGSMPLLLVGRRAARRRRPRPTADRATPPPTSPRSRRRARSLSTVVWAITIGAVAGPNLTGPAGSLARALGIPELTGPFALGSLGMLARRRSSSASSCGPTRCCCPAGRPGRPPVPPTGTSWGRVVRRSATRPVLGSAVLALAAAHAVMVSVMVMTPLHMEHGGAELRVIGIVISVHVLGMFAFAPLVGLAADRSGRAATLGVGAVVLAVSLVLCAASPEGSSWQIFAGLFLLGLGWSFATVSASTLVADHAPLDDPRRRAGRGRPGDGRDRRRGRWPGRRRRRHVGLRHPLLGGRRAGARAGGRRVRGGRGAAADAGRAGGGVGGAGRVGQMSTTPWTSP